MALSYGFPRLDMEGVMPYCLVSWKYAWDGVLKALVAVELQLHGDPLFLFPHGKTNGVQHQIHRLLRSGLVGRDTVIVEVTDHGQIQHTLLRLDVRNICYPFAVGPVCVKLPVE